MQSSIEGNILGIPFQRINLHKNLDVSLCKLSFELPLLIGLDA